MQRAFDALEIQIWTPTDFVGSDSFDSTNIIHMTDHIKPRSYQKDIVKTYYTLPDDVVKDNISAKV